MCRFNDIQLQTSTTAGDCFTSGVPLAPVLRPTLRTTATAGRQSSRVLETAINYSLPRSASRVENSSPKTGSGNHAQKRPRPETDDEDAGARRQVAYFTVCNMCFYCKKKPHLCIVLHGTAPRYLGLPVRVADGLGRRILPSAATDYLALMPFKI